MFLQYGLDEIDANSALLRRCWSIFAHKLRGMRPASFDSMDHDQITTDHIIGCAIAVHRALGPGLLESAYHTALCAELAFNGIQFDRDRLVPLEYRGIKVGDYRPDLIVEKSVVVEVKSVFRFEPVFTAQLLTYLRITGLRVGLLLNFNKLVLRDGIKRIVL